ncbi:coiled coil domain protein [Legionella lansingensis]|uniref:Coiled coil domain-containing protein n=1 Tax=Legionella lansingensis TaxID=45067 RepID=A0A0W0V772_9GAMM|nr:hypothetical protein [Legionella lansingensis]KTD15950.1 coiled coil domain-containing protein [Legionella lansingensis]SNV48472.1 coiled coil domain protein [Legionella lansingensis]
MGLFQKPLLRRWATTKKLDETWGPDKRREYIQTYLKSVNLDQGVTGSDSFDGYQQRRFRQIEDFLDYKDDKGNLILKGRHWEELKNDHPPHTQAVKDAVKDALEDTDELTDALTQFNNDFARINAGLKAGEIDPRQLPGILHVAKLDAKKAIEQHHTHAKHELEAKFNDPTPPPNGFKDKLKASMNLTDDAQVAKVKKEMLDTLDKKYKAELAEFENSVNKGITDIQTAIQREHDRISYLAGLLSLTDKNTSARRKAIQDLYDEHRRQNPDAYNDPVSLLTNPPTGDASLKGVRPDKLKLIHSITGIPITNENGTFHMQLPAWWQDPLYHNSRHQNVDYDIQNLAEAVRACGYDKIIMSVSCDNPDDAREYGRKMYEACINAGFDPDNITITVNGEKFTKKEGLKQGKDNEHPGLFQGFSDRWEKTEQRAKKLKEEREQFGKEPEGLDLQKCKNTLQELRTTPAPTHTGPII